MENNITQPVNTPEPLIQNSPEQPVKKQKRLSLIIFGPLILVIVVGVIAYYLAIQKNQSPTNQAQKTPSTDSSQNLPVPTASPAAITRLSQAWELGTKTYSNPKINITFDYPSYFETTETDIEKENKEWAEKYKNHPDVKQPLYRSAFSAWFSTPEIDTEDDMDALTLICDNKMRVSVQQYDNPQNMSLYNFIADLNKSYPGDGITEPFETYKKSLTQSSLPKVGSYVFRGIIGENPVKEIYFTNKDEVYRFYLIGNCNTGGEYTPDAEAVFDSMLKSVKYL